MFIKLIVILLPLALSHTCAGDFTQLHSTVRSKSQLITRSSTLSPIRMTFYSNFTFNNPTLDNEFQNFLLPLISNFWATTLQVYSVVGNLILTVTTCQSSTVPAAHRTTGLSNTDLVIYIASNTSSSFSYIASAGSCEQDTHGLGNPIAGGVLIGGLKYGNSSMTTWISNMLHEITHILGFSSSLFKYWRNSSGLLYPTGGVTTTAIMRGYNKTLIVTPTVVSVAKLAFGCNSMFGVELEDAGSSTDSGSHWDKRIMMNDYMVSTIPIDGIVSNITLALLQDTGWYNVNYILAQMPYYGRNGGCDFINRTCLESGVPVNASIWCNKSTPWGCDYFGLNKGGCAVSNYSTSLPKAFQYFSSSLQGGSDVYADYCPYHMPFSNGNCRGGSSSTFTFSESYEVIGEQSRCFISTLLQKPHATTDPVYAACYQVISCTNTSVTIQIANYTVVCPFTGLNITLPGFNGWFLCPTNNMVCNNVPCHNMCYARGVCSGLGVCNCFSGSGGDFCNVTCNPNCQTCSLTDNCSSCIGNYQLINDTCCPLGCADCYLNSTCFACSDGYYMDSNVCEPCPTECYTCNSTGDCITYKDNNAVATFLMIPDSESSSILLGKCVENSGGCHKCKDSEACGKCMKGYYLDFGTCIMCKKNCKKCESPTNCLECKNGYSLVGNSCNKELIV